MLAEFRQQLPDMLTVLQQVVELESPSNDKASLDRLISFLQRQVVDLGGKAEVVEQAERGNHLLATFGQGDKQLLVLCHIDTVWELGEIEARPFHVEGGKAYGPGVYDMKGGVVQTLFALQHLMQRGWPLDARVVVLFNSDEEIGSPTSRALIEEQARHSEAVFVLEPAIAPHGALKTSRKGVGSFHMQVTGIAAHAGSDPEKGASANLELAKQIIWLHDQTDFAKGTTVNAGVIHGGTRANVIAQSAEAFIDLRVETMEEAKRIVPAILARQAITPNTKVAVTGGLNRPPMERSQQMVELYQLAERLAAELGIEISEGSSGGGSDGNFTAALGVPTLDGLGAVGDGAHAEHEFLYVDKMPERTALLARLLTALGS